MNDREHLSTCMRRVQHQIAGAKDHSLPSAANCRSVPKNWRRRSADVGGLHLATMGLGQGQGWMGGDPLPLQTIYAELLSDMYTETMNSVNDHSLDSVPDALPEAVRSRLIHSLSRWYFEPHVLPEEEVFACTIILFEALFRIEGMSEVIPVDMRQIIAFLHHLRRIYRYENTYHNFEHALDVLQATHCYLKSAGMVPPPTILFTSNQLWKPQKEFNSASLVSCLGLRELFVLYIAAIGHDVGHPGFNNMFMKNANTRLSLLFDHTSALEQMHYQLLKRVMRCHGLGVFLDDPLHGQHVREILRSSVIFTDMGVHNVFMAQFKKLIEGGEGSISQRQILICQALLKNADISNPSRPFYVSTHWAKALMQEWKAQANLEEEYDLKPSVMSSTDPIKEADSQIFFISHFVRPMLQLTVKGVPEMSCYLNHLKSNLRTWVKRKDELSKQPPQSVLPLHPQVLPQQQQYDNEVLKGTLPDASPTSSSTILSSPSADCSPQSPPPPPPYGAPLSATTRTRADSFMTAFPLTLPTYPPKKYLASNNGSLVWIRPASSSSSSSSSSRSVSEHETGPLNSPSAESASDFRLQSQAFSPISEASLGINGPAAVHRCRSSSSVSNSSACKQCGGASVDPSSRISSPGPPPESNAFRIWCSPTQFSSTSADAAADDDDDEDEKHAGTAHAAIRNASLLGSLRQQRQKDAGGVVSLKDFMDGGSANGGGMGLLPPSSRRAVRYSWCAGMAGLSGDTEILSALRAITSNGGGGGGDGGAAAAADSADALRVYYPTLSRIPSASSSPEIPSRCDDIALNSPSSGDEDKTATSRPLTQLSGRLSIQPLSAHAADDSTTLMP